MTVLRIVADLAAPDPQACARFYRDVLGLEVAMDAGFIVTLGAGGTDQKIQLSLASQGGSGTPVPAISVEVEDLDVILDRVRATGCPPEYGPVSEPWGVRRFFVRDPAGNLINILMHSDD